MSGAVATLSVEDVALVQEWFNTTIYWCYERGIELNEDEHKLAQKLGLIVPPEDERS